MDTQPGIKNPSQGKHETYEIETKSKPRRALGGKGLLSHSISVQGLKKSILLILPLEKKRKNREEEEEDARREEAACYPGKRRERERGRGGI